MRVWPIILRVVPLPCKTEVIENITSDITGDDPFLYNPWAEAEKEMEQVNWSVGAIQKVKCIV